jgi:hypothetical protein
MSDLDLWLNASIEGVDPELWKAYVLDVRKKKKYTLTQRALDMFENKAGHLRDVGYDLQLCLQASYDAGWASIFPKGEPKVKALSAKGYGPLLDNLVEAKRLPQPASQEERQVRAQEARLVARRHLDQMMGRR